MSKVVRGAVALLAFFASDRVRAADLSPASKPAAADYSPPTVYSPAPAQDWSGLSIGVIGAVSLGRSGQSYTDGSFTTNQYNLRGGLIGIHSGLDHQTGAWVWGLGNDLTWSSVQGRTVGAPPGIGNATFSTRLEWLYTGYMRIGYSFDRFLPYFVAGPAFGSVKVSGAIPGAALVSNTAIWLGWGVGFGLEYAVTPNLIAKAEYVYVCLGESIQFSVDNAEFMTHLLRAGVDYRFDWSDAQHASNRVGAMPVKAPAGPYDWTGVYAGFNIGGTTGKVDTQYTLGGTAPFVGLHALTGIQAGYNRQFGSYLVGLETDFQLTGQSSDWQFPVTSGGVTAVINNSQDVPTLFTARARAGYAMDRWMFYATGGFAYGEVESHIVATIPGFGTISPNFEKSRPGWTAGFGVEAALWDNWTAKFEYLYVDFGGIDESFAGLGPFGTIASNTNVRDVILRMGLNRRFN